MDKATIELNTVGLEAFEAHIKSEYAKAHGGTPFVGLGGQDRDLLEYAYNTRKKVTYDPVHNMLIFGETYLLNKYARIPETYARVSYKLEYYDVDVDVPIRLDVVCGSTCITLSERCGLIFLAVGQLIPYMHEKARQLQLLAAQM